MNRLQRQIDLRVSGLHVREAEGEERSRTIEGHAVVFGVRSVNLCSWHPYREVYEVMEPGCITNDLLKRSDVVLTAFHDNTAILGRCRMGKGTLGLTLEARGLRIQCTLADTERANELLSAIERGDIDGMSFAYTADEEDSENGVSYERMEGEDHDGKEVWVRHVKKVTGLYDVTIAGHPAYPQTDVAQREVDAMLDTRIGEPAAVLAKREADRKAEDQRKEEERKQREQEELEQRKRLAAEMKRRERVLRKLDLDSQIDY